MNALKLFLLFLMISSAPALAQNLDTDSPRSQKQILSMGLYPPDLIMRHQQALGITDSQRKAMLRLVKEFQNEVAEVQWDLQNKQQIMKQALSEDRIDSNAVLTEIEQVLSLESQFKLAHFKLLIAIKNELTQEQIDLIKQTMRDRRRAAAARNGGNLGGGR